MFRTNALWLATSGLIFILSLLTPLEWDGMVVVGSAAGGLGMLAIGVGLCGLAERAAGHAEGAVFQRLTWSKGEGGERQL